MPHFFVDPRNISNGRFVLDPDESAHLARVLRKKTGDGVRLFDGVDRSFDGVLEEVSPQRVTGRIVGQNQVPSSGIRLRLFQAIPKGDTFDWILEKATELGVGEIVPFHARRNVARVPSDRVAAKRARWEKIVRAASAQCGRADVPAVSAPLEFDEVLDRLDGREPCFLAWEGEEVVSLKSVLSLVVQEGERMTIHVVVGPEGGLTPDEVSRARARGVVPVSLGPRILRTETAGLFVASAVLYESLR